MNIMKHIYLQILALLSVLKSPTLFLELVGVLLAAHRIAGETLFSSYTSFSR